MKLIDRFKECMSRFLGNDILTRHELNAMYKLACDSKLRVYYDSPIFEFHSYAYAHTSSQAKHLLWTSLHNGYTARVIRTCYYTDYKVLVITVPSGKLVRGEDNVLHPEAVIRTMLMFVPADIHIHFTEVDG